MGTIELTLEEVANKLNVSVKTVVTNWNKQRAKADALGIVKIGIGKNAKYICVAPTTKEQITYECLREYLIQECKFDIRTDFKKLIHYIYLVLLNTIDEEYHYNNLGYIQQLGISQRNLITYRQKLTNTGVLKPKSTSSGIYAYLNINNEYIVCDSRLHSDFIMCILSHYEKLLENKYLVDLSDKEDYQKAKDIIESEIHDYESLGIYPIPHTKEHIYKIAFYEVFKAWEEELGIKHVKFFPNHMINNFIVKDMDMIDMIVNAYVYSQI